MYDTTLAREAELTFEGIQAGETVRALIMPRWLVYQTYLQESGAVPEHLDEVPEASFSPFIRQCEQGGMADDELHLMISGIRMILLRSGWKPARLRKLVAPRRRVRIANSPTGEYQFMLVSKDWKRPAKT
jgi:hypothetical protein